MKPRALHSWQVSPKEAVEIQRNLAPRLRLTRLRRPVRVVAGTDVSAARGSERVWAAAVLCSYPDLHVIEEAWIEGRTSFPYVPGLLSFREIPMLLEALKGLKSRPDVILCDGQGTAHPRRMGLASHLGVFLNQPTIGCAKSRLVGEFSSLGRGKGDFSLLYHHGTVVGAAARTRGGVKPVFVSPGHRITLEESLEIVFRCSPVYRVPEPVRKAHGLVTRLRKERGAG